MEDLRNTCDEIELIFLEIKKELVIGQNQAEFLHIEITSATVIFSRLEMDVYHVCP